MKERKKNNKKDEERETQKVHNLLRQSLTHKQKDKKTKGKKKRENHKNKWSHLEKPTPFKEMNTRS